MAKRGRPRSLSDQQAAQIRAEFEQGESKRALAKRHGVSRVVIIDVILQRRAYKDIPDPEPEPIPPPAVEIGEFETHKLYCGWEDEEPGQKKLYRSKFENE